MTPRLTCQARLATTLEVGPYGFPVTNRKRCTQQVGVQVWTGAHGQIMAACSLPGHRESVEAMDHPYRVEAMA